VKAVRSGAIQIAGVHDAAEAASIVACGADFLGLPLRLDFHSEDCSDATAAAIIAGLPDTVESVLITYLNEAREIAALARRIGAGWVQLHGAVSRAEVEVLRHIAPGLRVAKSLIVRGGDVEALRSVMRDFAPHVDAFLTDTFDPDTGAEGATGRTHDWSISRALASQSIRPLVLAGGLTPDNVRRAIETVRPAAVDVHTGVEGADGRKDPDRLARFVSEARAGFAAVARRSPEP
jgi:phosphoribosylanthranilate isomerase